MTGFSLSQQFNQRSGRNAQIAPRKAIDLGFCFLLAYKPLILDWTCGYLNESCPREKSELCDHSIHSDEPGYSRSGTQEVNPQSVRL